MRTTVVSAAAGSTITAPELTSDERSAWVKSLWRSVASMFTLERDSGNDCRPCSWNPQPQRAPSAISSQSFRQAPVIDMRIRRPR